MTLRRRLRKARPERRRTAAAAATTVAAVATLASLVGASPASAGQFVPVPTVVIYPGDVIRDGMLIEREMPDEFAGKSAVVLDRSALVNKTSRRTLLPNLPIAKNAVGEPKLVSLGAMVRVVYAEGGLTISTYGSALQGGAAGDVIPVRNLESGLTISGIIEADGSVRVGNS